MAKVRSELERAGDVETVSTSIDTRGRKQPAKKAKPSSGEAATVARFKAAVKRHEEAERDRAECIALNNKCIEAEKALADHKATQGQKIITAEERKAQYAADETLATTPSGAPAENDEERVATDLGLELLLSLKDLVETGSASNRINMVGFIRTAIVNLAIDVTEVKKDASGAERRCADKILKLFKTQEAKAA